MSVEGAGDTTLKLVGDNTLRGGFSRAGLEKDDEYSTGKLTSPTAVAMTEQQVKSLHEKLEKLTGKTIDLKTKVDPAVLGGIRLDIEGTELDGTVQNRLSALRRDIASVTL